MATLFIAVDCAGAVRFVGDVPRGAECGCFCPVCKAALVAKQGDLLDWHFAHEAGTERPECRAGAMNLLRRLTVEEVQRRGVHMLPSYFVAHPVPGRAPLEWTAHPAGDLLLLESASAREPAATLPLREGAPAQVFVCIGSEEAPLPAGPDQPVLVVWCPLPELGVIRTDAQAREFVRRTMRLSWRCLPDFSGRLAAAREQARAAWEREQRERADRAGARWAQVRRTMQGPSPEREQDAGEPTLVLPAAPAAPAAPGPAPNWAPGLVAGTSIHYRAMDDGSQWVCFQCAPGQWRLCPVPHPHEGWDESFPLTIAVAEGDAWLRVVDFSKLLMLFNAHATASQIDSDPRVIEQLFRP